MLPPVTEVGSESIYALLEDMWREDAKDAHAFPKEWQPFVSRLCEGPDPEGALLAALQLPRQLFGSEALSPSLANLLHHGTYTARLLRLLPSACDVFHRILNAETGAVDIKRYQRQLLTDLRDKRKKLPPALALAQIRTREYLHLAHLETTGFPLEVTGSSLSALASACTHFALESVHLDEVPLSEIVVAFGMGKLGGYELNFLSDIDLIFVHRDDLNEGSRRKLHDRLRKVVALLEGEGQWKPLFRVDLRLRPFGSQGPLSLSLSATENYYERHGRSWERQAWLRALPIAGDLNLGEELEKRLRPFVYRRTVGPEIFEEISELMYRARRDGQHRRTVGGSIDLKLDAGGIREVEFFAQALLLLNGGKNPGLQSRSTLGAIDRLAAAGLISDREHQSLSEAYRWLRKVEHRLQLSEGQATHTLPDSEQQRFVLAKRLASANLESADSEQLTLDGFDRQCSVLRSRVLEVTQTIYPSPKNDPSHIDLQDKAEPSLQWAREILLDAGSKAQLRIKAFRALGFRDPEEANALLDHLYSRPRSAFVASPKAVQGAQNLLLACLESADPDHALSRLVDFASRRPGHYAAWRFFAHPSAHETVRRVADLFGASDPLSRGLIGFPNAGGIEDDGGLSLLLEASRGELPHRDDFEEHFVSLRRRHPNAPTEQLLLRLKQRELVRIGLVDLGQQSDPFVVGRSLADLADFILNELARSLVGELQNDPKSRLPAELEIAIFAAGKLGMRAMDYGSDLDLFFIHDGTEAQTHFRVQELGRRILRAIQGVAPSSRLYEVDMRLRPSGQQGFLVSSLGGFRTYHQNALPLWERMALLHCRPIAELRLEESGLLCPNTHAAHPDKEKLSTTVTREILPNSIYCAHAPHLAQERRRSFVDPLRTLKQRIEDELARESEGIYNVKTGVGGCLELEFIVSALQIEVGMKSMELRGVSLLEALEILAKKGRLDEAEAQALRSAYFFERRLLNRLRLSHSGASLSDPDRLVTNSPLLAPLARRMGMPDRNSLLESYQSHRGIVRQTFDRHFPH